jgi:SynChlorMet cassette protein ScmC
VVECIKAPVEGGPVVREGDREVPWDGAVGTTYSLVRASQQVCRDVQTRGGVLLHGALIRKGECGFILAGPGGVGKTTACGRLPRTWECMSDDMTLVVRDADGFYRAHPWPTWSRLLRGELDLSWRVANPVNLSAVLLLRQGAVDAVTSIDQARAVCMLTASAEQAWTRFEEDHTEVRSLRLQRFESVCALVRGVPVHMLDLSRSGRFWEEIERALCG